MHHTTDIIKIAQKNPKYNTDHAKQKKLTF